MTAEPIPKPRRIDARLKDYDYSQAGAYFVTICSRNLECIFGEIVGEEAVLSEIGCIIKDELIRTEFVRDNVIVDRFVVMPNHVHAIFILADVGATRRVARNRGGDSQRKATHRVAPTGPASGSIGAIVGQIKSIVTKRTSKQTHTPRSRDLATQLLRARDSK